jgi:hypothetical protein
MMKFFALTLLFCSAHAAYPASYPFENESLVPVAPRASTPSYTFDESDPGGYVYYHVYTLTEVTVPFALFGTTGMGRHYQAFYGMTTDLLPPSWFNCTDFGLMLGPGSYLSEIAGITMCDPDNCCPKVHGLYTFWDSAFDPEEYESETEVYELGQCSEPYFEDLFCGLFDRGLSGGWCIDYAPSEDEREVMFPCYDSVVRYYFNCVLYKTAGFVYDKSVEPQNYYDSSTGDEQISQAGVYRRPDKVCHPYSYYYPESSSSASGSSSGGSSSSAPVLASSFLFALGLF